MILSKSIINDFNPDDFRNEILTQGKIGTLLSIVPTRRRIRNLSRYFIKKYSLSVDSLHIETIETAAEKLLRSSDTKFNMINDAVSIVLLRECFEENREKLNYFPKDVIPNGTLDKLKNLISEYKRHPIFTSDLLEEINQDLYVEGDVLKVQDIIILYDAYNHKCEQLSLKEIGDIYLSLNLLPPHEITSLFRKNFPDVSTIIIEGYNQFSESELELINHFSGVCNVFIDFDFFEDNENVFSHISKIKERLHDLNWKVISKDNKSTDLRNYLGNNFSKTVNIKKDYSANISIIECSTRAKEVEIIAKQIKKLLIEGESQPHKICVVFHDISKYSDIIRDKFSSCLIPFNLTDRKLLSSSIPVSALLFFLQIHIDDYYYKNILRSFSNGFISLNKDNGSVNNSNLLECAAKLKITGGLNNWKTVLSTYLAEIGEAGENYFKYKSALEDITAIESALKPFIIDLSPSEFHNEILSLIDKLNLIKNISDTRYNIEENARSFRKFLDSLQELLEFHFKSSDNEKYPLSFFYNMIITAVSRERFALAERSNYGVFVSNLDEARGLKFDHVFIGGLIDGELPTPYKPELLVLRKKNEGNISKSEIQQIRERHLFYQTMCSFWQHVYLSFPVWEEKRQYEKSVFIKEIENILIPKKIEEIIYSSIIASREELLRNYRLVENISQIEDLLPLEKIKDDIVIEKQRENDSEAITRFTGYLIPESDVLPGVKKEFESVLENVKNKLDSERTYSISQFEKYASCPFKYFSERMLCLNQIEEPKEEIEKTELGTLVHKVFCEFYNKYGLEKQITESDKEYALKLIFEIAEKASINSFITHKDFYEKEKVFGINGDHKDSILFKFIENEISAFDGFVPWQLEYSFSGYELNGVNIKGQIDRIDINRGTNQFRVIDYKLGGKAPAKSELLKGFSLQLPIYIEIAKRVLFDKEAINFMPESGIIYSLKIAEEFGRKVVIKSEKISEYSTISIEKIIQYSEDIKKGHFNMSGFKRKGPCDYCDFSNICRVR